MLNIFAVLIDQSRSQLLEIAAELRDKLGFYEVLDRLLLFRFAEDVDIELREMTLSH